MTGTAVRALASRTRWLAGGDGDDPDPLAFLGDGGCAWLHDGVGFATAGVAARVPVRCGSGRIDDAAADVAEALAAIEVVGDDVGLPGTGPLAVGALPFADDRPGELVIPALLVGRTADGRSWVTEVGPAHGLGSFAHPRPWSGGGGIRRSTVSAASALAPRPGDEAGRRAFTSAVSRALERIEGGTLTKVVLARQVEVPFPAGLAVRDLLERLRAEHPSCFTFAAGRFVGSSPELLVRRQGDDVASRPMAGSVAIGAGPAEDERRAAQLAQSLKDLDEHDLVVEAVREALAPLCRDVAAGRPEVVRLATVAHLASTVTGRLAGPRPSALALVARLHPTPAVGGLPRPEALAAIADLEGFDRGLYAGPVGWVDSRGDGEWAVALRCAQLDGDRALVAAGAGIVAGSEPDAEWVETEAKLAPMLRALSA